jgi:F-type H+-transporting ATPase subunit gamma
MQTLELIRRRIDSATELASVVGTMKALAAVNIQHFEAAVESLAEYTRAIRLGMYVVLRDQQQPARVPSFEAGQPVMALVFGSDQGLCGPFNEQITNYALRELHELRVRQESRTILAVGARAAVLLEASGQAVENVISVPSSVTSIIAAVQQSLVQIEGWRAEGSADRVLLFYSQRRSAASHDLRTLRLWPVDLERYRVLESGWPSRVLPTYTMERDRLFSALIRQHLLISLYRAFAESLASENASRLVTMQAAERNIEEHLSQLNAQYHQQRQNSITDELLDIVSGFEVLTGEPGRAQA